MNELRDLDNERRAVQFRLNAAQTESRRLREGLIRAERESAEAQAALNDLRVSLSALAQVMREHTGRHRTTPGGWLVHYAEQIERLLAPSGKDDMR